MSQGNSSRPSHSSYHLLPSEEKSEKQTSSSRSDEEEERYLFDLPFQTLAIGTACLPLFGFFFCIFWSLLIQFNKTTATHCNVFNLLPSLSAATGSFYPQKYVWKHAIALHTVPRLVVVIIYYMRHGSPFIALLNVVEISSLLGLALVGSNENYSIHSKCFGLFLVSALIYMFLVSYTDVFKWCRGTLQIKKWIAWANLFLLMSAAYFFLRHNSYCEPYIYSFFALSEYLIVLSNIYFHTLAYYDLCDVHFALISRKPPINSSDHVSLSSRLSSSPPSTSSFSHRFESA